VPSVQVPPGVEGIVRLTELPDDSWQDRWDRIFAPEGVKDRLLNYLVFALRNRAATSEVGLAMHGLLVLAGPPGTGKTTLAGGLADQAARILADGPVLFADINPHAFPSQMLGESQRSVARLFERTIPDLAKRGRPLIILIDEVEALAVNRSGASLETNPVDVHRSTDAVLAGVDRVAGDWPNVVFLATTNFPRGVDPAFLSRADLVQQIGLPGIDAVAAIVADTLGEVGAAAGDPEELQALAASCVAADLDARQIRKLVIRTASSSRALALAPKQMTVGDLAAELARGLGNTLETDASDGTGRTGGAQLPPSTAPRTR
jgi:pachytene checkpoint protein 2